MTSVRNSDADRFLAHPPHGCFAFLIHGADNGLVTERAALAVRTHGAAKEDVIQFDADSVSKEPEILADEFFAVPMFGGKRALRIEAGGRNISGALEPLLQGPPGDCIIVVTAGALKRDAPLRKLFEASASCAAVECIADDAGAVQRLIESELAAAGLSISAEARALLISRLGADRMLSRGEISKLICFTGSGEITPEHIHACVTGASEQVMDEVVDEAFAGSRAVVDAASESLRDIRDVSAVLSATLRHALLLHKSRTAIESGTSLSQALAQIWLPVKRKARVESHLRSWTAERLLAAVEVIDRAGLLARRDAKMSALIASKALWAVASMARAAR